MRVIHKLPEHLLMTASVLQGHQIGVRTNQRAVFLQRALTEHRLDEYDYQINGLHILRIVRDGRMIDRAASVRFSDC